MHLDIRVISLDDPRYAQATDLRERVLLAPIGWTMREYLEEASGREERCEHFVALMDHPAGPRVVGTAILLHADLVPEFSGPKPAGCEPFEKDGARLAKVMQVAVDPQLRGQGVGRQLMIAAEAHAAGPAEAGGLGLDGVYCHAQSVAIPFYEAVGWTISSDEFEEAGILHRRMEMRAARPQPSAEPELADDF